MAQRPSIPKFGNWENANEVPYTVHFENARKNRNGGKIINPNDPQENPDIYNYITNPTQGSASPRTRTKSPEEPKGRGAAFRSTNEQRGVRRENGGLKNYTESPSNNQKLSNKSVAESAQRYHGSKGSSISRTSPQSGGSELNIEGSPLHQNYHGRLNGKGSGSPSLDGKYSYDSSHGTHGRSRLQPLTRGNETPERGGAAAVPRFGEWGENPSSADNYTELFNVMRKEKQNGVAANASPSPRNKSSTNIKKPEVNDSCKVCCFPWPRK